MPVSTVVSLLLRLSIKAFLVLVWSITSLSGSLVGLLLLVVLAEPSSSIVIRVALTHLSITPSIQGALLSQAICTARR
jgi:hypothetical protein